MSDETTCLFKWLPWVWCLVAWVHNYPHWGEKTHKLEATFKKTQKLCLVEYIMWVNGRGCVALYQNIYMNIKTYTCTKYQFASKEQSPQYSSGAFLMHFTTPWFLKLAALEAAVPRNAKECGGNGDYHSPTPAAVSTPTPSCNLF